MHLVEEVDNEPKVIASDACRALFALCSLLSLPELVARSGLLGRQSKRSWMLRTGDEILASDHFFFYALLKGFTIELKSGTNWNFRS